MCNHNHNDSIEKHVQKIGYESTDRISRPFVGDSPLQQYTASVYNTEAVSKDTILTCARKLAVKPA